MKTGLIRILPALLAGLFQLRPAAAQEIVVDPTHIGVAVENTASSLEEMITMIEEMFALNDKLDGLYGLSDKVGEVADRFREVGYLVDMTESYNDLLRRTCEYAARIREWAGEGELYGYERQLRYLYRCEMQGMRLFNGYMDYFRSLKTSDADKAEQAQMTLRELERARIGTALQMDGITQARELGLGLSEGVRFLEESLSPRDYVDTYRHLGSADYAATAWIAAVRIVMGIVYLLLVVTVMVTVFRGQEQGTVTGTMAPIRWFVGATLTWTLLEILNKVMA